MIQDGVVGQCYSPLVCVFATFHVVSRKRKAKNCSTKLKNGWNQNGLALGCSMAKLLKSSRLVMFAANRAGLKYG